MKRRFCLKIRLPAVLLFFLGVCTPLFAAERTWDGSSRDNDWTAAANWAGIGAPVPGDSLRFPAGALHLSNSNDYPAGTIFTALTYAGAGYNVRGNSIALSNGVSVTHASGNTILYLPITLRDDQTFSVSQTAANLFLFGDISMGTHSLDFSGPGDFSVFDDISNSRFFARGTVRKLGTGTLLLLGHATHDGPTLVNGGTLRVDGSLSNSTVTVNSGATLTGLGKVGRLRANAGAIVQPGGATPQFLDSLGDLELNAGSTLNIRLNGTNAGFNHDQLRVKGAITLGGTLNLIPGFTPAVGDEFTIIKNDGTNQIVGTFAGLPEGAEFTINGRPCRITYGGRRFGGIFDRNDDVIIEAIPALAVWDGGGGVNNLWSQPINWTNDIAPMPGDDIQFNTGSFNFGSPLLTTNDFPAGRLFGSLLIGPRHHRIIGNALVLNGRIEVDAGTSGGTVDIYPALTLKGGIMRSTFGTLLLRGAINLSGNQSFRIDHNAANLVTYDGLWLNGHTLTVDCASNPSFLGSLNGPGELIKSGPGTLTLSNAVTSSCRVREGTVVFESSSSGSTPVIVEGGTLVLNRSSEGGFIPQTLRAEAGGIVYVPRYAAVADATMLSGSTLSMEIYTYSFASAPEIDYTTSSRIEVLNNYDLDISGCSLQLSIASSADRVTPLVLIAPYYNDGPVTGTFAGLPEGAVFIASGRAYTITYRGGSDDNQVILYPISQFVWDGGGADANWSTAANWTPDFAPPSYSHLVFPANVSERSVWNDTATTFPSITFNAPDYTVGGNRVVADLLACNYDGEVLMNAELSVSGNIDIVNSATLRVEGGFSGNSPTKIGAGTLRLAGASPISPSSIIVQAGLLELAKKTGINAVSSSLKIEGGVARLVDDDQIADSADVTVEGAGQFELNGQTEVIDTLSGAGTVELSERFFRFGRLTVRQGNFSGRFVGAGTLVKMSSEILTLTGVSPFTGTAILQLGELRMDCVQTNSTIRMDGGALTGRGFVGPITGNAGGTVWPGLGGAQYESALHCRDVSFNSTTTFRPVLTSSSPDFEGHKLQVNGTVNLGGCRLLIDFYTNFKPTNTASFVIIDNDGSDPVTGTFAGVPEGGTIAGEGFLFQVSYRGGTGNDVVLTRVPAPASTMLSVAPIPNGQMRVEGLGLSGLVYTIQGTRSLNPIIQWNQIGAATAGNNGIFQLVHTPPIDPVPPFTNRVPRFFYRAISP